MVTENTDGTLTFRVYYPHAATLEIHGSFAAPGGISMERGEDGWWSVRRLVPAGDHTFRYVANGQNPLPDYAAGGLVRDESGAWLSCLHVPARMLVPGADAEGAVSATRGAEGREDAGRRTVALTEEEVEALRAGRRVEVALEDGRTALVTVVGGAAGRWGAREARRSSAHAAAAPPIRGR